MLVSEAALWPVYLEAEMSAPTYPLTLPTSPAFVTSRWALQSRTAVSTSPFTGNQQVAEFDYALWTVDLTLPPMKRAAAVEWQAFLLQLHGRRGTFLLGDPDGASPRGAATGTITLHTGASPDDFTVDLVTSTQQSTSGFLKKGDWIQIGGGSAAKLHMVMADTDTNSSGVCTATIEPKIKSAISSGTNIVVSSAQGVFRLTTDEVYWDTNVVSNYGITLACRESA